MSDPMTGWMPPGGEEDTSVLPSEFRDVDAEIQRQVGIPEPAPERLITPLNPEGKAPKEGMSFGQNVRGSFRTSGTAGVMSERAQQETVATGGGNLNTGGFAPSQLRNMPERVRQRILAESAEPETQAQRLKDAEDAFFEQVAYDNSKANLSAESAAGSVVGTFLNPENLFGLSGVLVRQFPALASRPVVTSVIDNAIVNTAADVGAQTARTLGGAQEEYDPLQTALSAVIGGGFGAAVEGARAIPSFVRADLASRVGRDAPSPGGNPAKTSVEVTARFPEYQAGEAALQARVAPMETAPNGRAAEVPDAAGVREPGRVPESVATDQGGVRADTAVGTAVPQARAIDTGAAPEVELPGTFTKASDLALVSRLDRASEDVPAAPYKAPSDVLTRDAEQFAQSAVSNPSIIQGLGSVDVETRGNVLPVMRGLLQDEEIAKAVVRLLPVDVMNMLGGKELAPKALFDKPAMLVDLLPVNANDAIPSRVKAADVLAPYVALATAERPLVRPQTASVLRDALAARATAKGDLHVSGKVPYPNVADNAGDVTGARLPQLPAAAKVIADDGTVIPARDYVAKQADAQFVEAIRAKPITPELKADLTPPADAKSPAEQIVRAAMDGGPPKDEAAYINAREYASTYAKQYEGGKSSRAIPSETQIPPVGSWRIADFKGLHGRDIEQLRVVKIDDLLLPEVRDGKLDPTKAGDDLTYAQWIKEGKEPPPIEVMQREDGKLAVADGHRRVLAAKAAGQTEVKAWVSELADHPQGLKDSNGKTLKVSLTHEIAMARAAEPKTVAELEDAITKAANATAPEGMRVKASSVEQITATVEARVAGSDPELTTLFRKRGAQPVQSLPPDQIQNGRPVATSGQPAPAEPVRVQRLEDLSRNLIKGFESLGRQGGVQPGARGQFGTKTGVIRVRSIADIDTVIHEVAHDFHLTEARADVDALVARNVQELSGLGAGDPDPKGDKEAFAELFRMYATNPLSAAKQWPNAFVDLDTLLRTKYPERHKVLQETAKQLDAIHRAPSGELVTADTISATPPRFPKLQEAIAKDYDPSGRTLYSAMDALYTHAIDKDHPIWKAVEGLRRVAQDNGKGFEVLPADDPYILMRLAGGSNGVASTQLEHGVIRANGTTPEGASLGSGIQKALGDVWGEEAFKDFGAYATARRMVAEYKRFLNGELPNPPGKFSLADYQQAVAQYEAKYPTFRDGMEDIYEFQRNHLKRAYEKGLYTKEFYDAALAREDYVPFVRDMADFKEMPSGTGAPSSTLRYSVMKAFRGSQRSVQNPLESIFKKVHDLEFVIARNDAVNAMARLVDEAGPGSGAIGEHVPSNQLTPQRVDVIEALRSAGKKSGVDDQDLKNLILQAEDLLQDSTVTTLFRQAPINAGEKDVTVYRWVNGERRALRLADGRFGREMYHAFTVMSDVERNWFISALQVGQQMLRTGVTRSAAFLLVNPIRDQLTAPLTGSRHYRPFYDAAIGAIEVLNKGPDALAYAGRGGMAAGAITEALDRGDFGRNVWGLEKAGVVKKLAAGDVLGSGSAFLHRTVQALELSEASTRMGLYKSYIKQAKELGFDDFNANLFATFRATDYIDFRKAGASMGLLRRWIPFLNASLQGNDREFRAAFDLPVLEAKRARGEKLSARELDRLKDARVAWVRVMLLGSMVGGGIALMNADKPEWQSANEFTRNTNYLFQIPGTDTWIAIPKPFGIVQSISNAFERGVEYAIRKDPSLFGVYLDAVGEAFKPPAHNPFIGTFYDATANYDRFRDTPIVPFYMQGMKPSEQVVPGMTSGLAVAMGQVFGWSPMKVDYVIRNLGASLATDFLKWTDSFFSNQRPEKQIYDQPVISRFVKNLVRGNAANKEFLKLVGEKNGEYEQAEKAYRAKINFGTREAAAQYLQGLSADHKVWVTMQALGLEANEKRLHPMQNARDHTGIISGFITQLNLNNVLREGELDRKRLTISRRDAAPMVLAPSTRAKLVEAFQELSMATARNAMVAIEAKGTKGLPIIKTDDMLARIKALSPEVYDEYVERRATKKIADPDYTFKVWPEVKARVLRDGENADLTDLVPREMTRTRRRRKAA